MICYICTRESRGFGFSPAIAKRPGNDTYYCSMRCLKMRDKTKSETEALEGASRYGGEYFEEQGIAVSCSREQWMQFIECVVTGWTDTLRNKTDNADLPI